MAPSGAIANGRPVELHGVVTGIPEVPVTITRPPSSETSKIKHPELPRANKAVSAEKPDGGSTASNRSVLQQHVDFFDTDRDGLIYPMDTYRGFHKIGFNPFLSFFAIFVIHGTFSWPSQGSWLPDPLFSLNTANMHRTKHGSDTESYDTEGRFNPEKFEEIFSKFDSSGKGGLYWKDMWTMIKHYRNVFDPTGWTAMFLEWGALWLIAADKEGFVSKEVIRAQYDGSLWYKLAQRTEKERQMKKAQKKKA
ncbi:hypothetical protein CVIRNUC_008671 [Coccomyxa viridis]|uniref:Caleosin n=1 Tax=Coccomyxa viridis TaxID=1274662 RepID=A0AAV1IE52_9CHLO|nr:hypothetical protein CVIRNUC_008671 [Coccomyxa viridis]